MKVIGIEKVKTSFQEKEYTNYYIYFERNNQVEDRIGTCTQSIKVSEKVMQNGLVSSGYDPGAYHTVIGLDAFVNTTVFNNKPSVTEIRFI